MTFAQKKKRELKLKIIRLLKQSLHKTRFMLFLYNVTILHCIIFK